MSHQLWSTLIKHGITPNQVYFLDCCRYKIRVGSLVNEQAEANIAKAKGYLTDEGVLTPKALEILDEFETYLVKTKKKVATSVLGEGFMDRIKEYLSIFPAQKLPSGQLARQSPQELKDKFIWFFKTYPEYDWNMVLDATDVYVYEKKKENYMYMATSSYFIKKADVGNKTFRSALADYCQILIDNPDFLNNIR
jgi:hypothetical protein